MGEGFRMKYALGENSLRIGKVQRSLLFLAIVLNGFERDRDAFAARVR